jgi:hypothetical protein
LAAFRLRRGGADKTLTFQKLTHITQFHPKRAMGAFCLAGLRRRLMRNPQLALRKLLKKRLKRAMDAHC